MCSWGNTTNIIAPIYIYKIFYMEYAYILYRISIAINLIDTTNSLILNF